ncbi:DUF4389 domain-containing protein [Methylophaga sp. OBS3]|uniref:DUF4389 domain-containing protein n=1 Tax=Methylophaga sp. OBS3 TaxID=2991934 RepID=UPI00224FCA82|nr:DUF4389 domain-containing protein [Methylophaga sp. OBS3]MCX4188793.1 DUF4389 domain-containing protein [Methylophaga sp. OBS3]
MALHPDAPTNSERTQLIRLLYMLLFGLIMYMALMVLVVVVIVQFVFALFADEPNTGIRNFSRDLAQYIHQITLFLTYNDERRPFPFNPLYDEVVEEEDDSTAAYEAEFQDITDKDSDNKTPKN